MSWTNPPHTLLALHVVHSGLLYRACPWSVFSYAVTVGSLKGCLWDHRVCETTGRCSTWEWLLLSVAPSAFVKGAKYTVSIYYLQGMVMVCVVVHHGHFCKASQPAQPLLLREVILLQEYSFGVYLRALEGSLFFFFLKHLPLDFALVRIRVATKTKSTVKNSSK